jgi:hypothetical protein
VSCDLKQVPPTIRWLVRPALLLSLGLHALLLLLPLLPDRASESEEASDPEETQVTLAPLPIEPVPSPSLRLRQRSPLRLPPPQSLRLLPLLKSSRQRSIRCPRLNQQ